MKTLERNSTRTLDSRNGEADICVFVEGTYPYVTGGVSAWLHHLITNLPEFTFAIFHLGSKPEPGRAFKYKLPINVISFQEMFLSNYGALHGSPRSSRPSKDWEGLKEFHEALSEGKMEEAVEMLRANFVQGAGPRVVSEFIYSEEAWKALVERYYAHAPSAPFLDYFWTFRSTHLPIFTLNDTTFPRAKLYHAVSTGYAGYAAALAKLQHGSPMLITEHGIYTRERDMEIALSSTIDEPPAHKFQLDPQAGLFKTWWTDMFRFISRFAYEVADSIISITGTNQQYQLRDGADPSKLRLVSNGIDVERFQNLNVERRANSNGFTVGFVGRVVPIKDVKCFIQAIKIANAEIAGLEALIIGPTDEDPEYFSECQQLTGLLDMDGIINFTGRANVFEYYPRMDVLVLTSLSEGQPLVILEANCAGVPVVASEVGACRDLLEGITEDDKALGPSGLLTLPASPDQTAAAIIQLWKDKSLCQQMARAGRQRVTKFYREDAVYAAYRDLYWSHIALKQAEAKV
ncbi:MAG TPA: GT4 family glycosyltransferase PelF [Anaerolineales bacterium]|nr:GT4 family glycosyltransferase PelF [Anaerolineales bacterium]